MSAATDTKKACCSMPADQPVSAAKPGGGCCGKCGTSGCTCKHGGVSVSAAAVAAAAPVKSNEPPLRMCCACPDTKKTRDQCVIEKGEDFCKAEIDAHNICLRAAGFKI